jgi:5-methylcytosine-specific restriction endonuclease McrA
MVKIKLSDDMNSWYLKEIGKFFKRGKTYSYKQIAKIVKESLGVSYKELLITRPKELEEIAQNINENKPRNFEEDKKILIDVYEKFRNSVSSKNYIHKVSLKVCPYCNRNYIFNFTKNDKEEATAQLDHFIDKSKYPYLSLSLYNLVPSCSVCNQRKSAQDILKTPILNPFEDNIHNHISFNSSEIISRDELENKNLDFFSEERTKITINVNSDDKRVEEHLKTFNIEGLYNHHTDVVADLYKKRIIYSDEYIDELLTKYGEIFQSREELIGLITCGYMNEEELNQRPLSKLIRDISDELGLI